MLKQRILTALLLIPVVILAILFLPPFGFAALLLIFLIGAGWEWTFLIKLKNKVQRILYVYLLTFLFLLSGIYPEPFILWLGLLVWILGGFFVFRYDLFIRLWQTQKILHYLLGVFILIPCWCALLLIRQQPHYFTLLMILFLMIWSTDTCGYFVGRRFGKTKLAPEISPGKTKIGTWGALILTAIFTAIVAGIFVQSVMAWLSWIGLSLVTSLAAILGDLVESMIKRQAGVKDSGRLLPGHGGILDRLDSLTAASPIFALGLLIMHHVGIL